jgi:hypothetical protein
MTRKSIHLSTEAWEKVRIAAKTRDISMRAYVEELILIAVKKDYSSPQNIPNIRKLIDSWSEYSFQRRNSSSIAHQVYCVLEQIKEWRLPPESSTDYWKELDE